MAQPIFSEEVDEERAGLVDDEEVVGGAADHEAKVELAEHLRAGRGARR